MDRNESLTNNQRAEAGFRAVRNYQESDFDVETGIVDLMADLLHLAREYGIEPDYVTHTAQMHFWAEVEEEAAAPTTGTPEAGYHPGSLADPRD